MDEIVKSSLHSHFMLLLLLFSIVIPQGLIRLCCLSLSSTAMATTVTSGAHCPLQYAASPSKNQGDQHCPMHEQEQKQQRQELRCQCCPLSSTVSLSDFSIVRFLLPHRLTDEMFLNVERIYVLYIVTVSPAVLIPPDPPPRPCLSISI